jgi:hypothetical protein
MRYMLLLYQPDEMRREPGAPGSEASLAAHAAFMADCSHRRALLATGVLARGDTATSVRVRDGETLITDGPFAETRECLAGFYMLDCGDLDEALELAARCPAAAEGTVEVRPLHEGMMAQVAALEAGRGEANGARSADS